MAFECIISGRGWTSFTFKVAIVLITLFLWKNALILKVKLQKSAKAERSFSIQDVISDPSAYDALTLASVIYNFVNNLESSVSRLHSIVS